MSGGEFKLTREDASQHRQLMSEVAEAIRIEGATISDEATAEIARIAWRYREGGVESEFLLEEMKRSASDQIGVAIKAEMAIREAAKSLKSALVAAPPGVQLELVQHLENLDIPAGELKAMVSGLLQFGDCEGVVKPSKAPGRSKTIVNFAAVACWRLLDDDLGMRAGCRVISKVLSGTGAGVTEDQIRDILKVQNKNEPPGSNLGSIQFLERAFYPQK